MPTYDFECQECGAKVEQIHPMKTAPKIIKCEECGGRMNRLIGAGSPPIFKGPGFHCNDYKKNENIVKKIMDNAPADQLAKGGIRKD